MSTRSRSSPDGALAAHPHAVDRDVEGVRLEGGARWCPTGGQDPTPVGVLAVDGALEQVAAGQRPSDLDARRPRWPRRSTSMRTSLLAPSASPTSWRARSAQTAVTAAVSCWRRGLRAGGAARQQQHRVVGGHAAVGVDPVEGHAGRRPQGGVEVRGVGHGVGGDDDEHRGQRRARACRRPWPCRRREPGARPGDACLATVSVVMIAAAAAGPPSGASAVTARSTPPGSSVHRQPYADQPGRADGDLARTDAQDRGGVLGGARGCREAVRARARVGAAGVEDDRPERAGASGPARSRAPVRP